MFRRIRYRKWLVGGLALGLRVLSNRQGRKPTPVVTA